MIAALDTASIPSATLCDFYRYAFLLTGDAGRAEEVLVAACSRLEEMIGQLRGEEPRKAWLVMRIRESCAQQAPASSNGRAADEASLLARTFSKIIEPDRTALALFYLNLFSIEEIAEILEMDLEETTLAIGRARKVLQQTLPAIPNGSVPPDSSVQDSCPAAQ